MPLLIWRLGGGGPAVVVFVPPGKIIVYAPPVATVATAAGTWTLSVSRAFQQLAMVDPRLTLISSLPRQVTGISIEQGRMGRSQPNQPTIGFVEDP